MPAGVEIVTKFNHLPRVNPNLRRGAARGLNTGIMTAIGYADPLTPVDTGLLKGNKSILNASPDNLTAQVTWNQFYAWYLEGGTSRGIRPHRFAAGGSEQAQPALVAAMRAVGAELI